MQQGWGDGAWSQNKFFFVYSSFIIIRIIIQMKNIKFDWTSFSYILLVLFHDKFQSPVG